MAEYLFNQDIEGSINGYDIKEYKAGQIIDEKDLCEELITAWEKREIITLVKSEDEEAVDGADKGDDENKSNTGDEDVDKFLNGETDKLPEGTQIISEEDAKKLLENSEGKSEENQEENAEKEENGENADEKLLIDEAKKILASEDTSIDTDRLKEIGIALHIQNMGKTVNAETIVNKIKKYIEDYEEKEQNEADADNVQE